MNDNFFNLFETQVYDWRLNVLSLVLCVVFSYILKNIYSYYSRRLGMRGELAKLLPILSLTVFMVILVVKQSLALSLGLVGALSIVRFRTPLKEPEDLIFFFIAIGIGLGFGANQIQITIISSLTIFLVLYFQSTRRAGKKFGNYTISLFYEKKEDSKKINDILMKNSLETKFLREERNNNNVSIIYSVYVSEIEQINEFVNLLEKEIENIQINITENQGNW